MNGRLAVWRLYPQDCNEGRRIMTQRLSGLARYWWRPTPLRGRTPLGKTWLVLASFDVALVLGALSLQSWFLGMGSHWPEGKFFLIQSWNLPSHSFLSVSSPSSALWALTRCLSLICSGSALGIVWWWGWLKLPLLLTEQPLLPMGGDSSLSHPSCLLCVHLSCLCSAKEQAMTGHGPATGV